MFKPWCFDKIVSLGKYDYAVCKNHPNATKHGYVLLHRLIMENKIERLLLSDEVIHHKNGNGKDNRIENLQLMTISEHSSLHALQKGQSWYLLKCPNCGKNFERISGNTFLHKKQKYNFTCCSKQCSTEFLKIIKLYGINEDILNKINNNIIEKFKKFNK